jgi:phytoene dehydrogenase-like protein
MKAIVIGSGLSGLTAALTLLRSGHQVEIFEQAEVLGGVTCGYTAAGYTWDYGQLVIEGLDRSEPIGRILEDLGVLDKIDFVPDDREYIFPDFEIRIPETYAGVLWRINRLKELFPEEATGLDRYWKDFTRFTRMMTLARRLEDGGLGTKIAFYLALLPLISKKDWSAERLMAHYFKSEQLKAVFISILADFFTPPSQFMGLGVFALNAEVTFEKRMPVTLARNTEMVRFYTILGGMPALVKTYVDEIQAAGGQLHTACAVTKILVNDGRVQGIVDENGITHPCDIVLASGGAKETLLGLVDEDAFPPEFREHVRSIPLMDSVFMLHLGVDYDPSETLHTVATYFYGSYDIEGEVKRAKNGEYHEGEAGFVVHFPSLRSPQMAPEGRHALTIYTICPEKLPAGDWETNKEKYAEALLGYAEKHIPGLREHVVERHIITPLDLRKVTHLQHHAFGGISPVMNAWKVPHQTPIEGLWFIGAQSESGGGMNNVIPAAYRVARQIR